MKRRLKEEEAEKVLESDAFVGRIIKLSAVAESRVDHLLAHYFLKREAFEYLEDFLLHVTERLGFSAKIEILSRINLASKPKSYTTLLRILRGLSYLRNKVAHDYYITGVKLTNITDNKDAMMFVTADRKEQGRLKSQMEVCFRYVYDSINKTHALRAQQGAQSDAPASGEPAG